MKLLQTGSTVLIQHRATCKISILIINNRCNRLFFSVTSNHNKAVTSFIAKELKAKGFDELKVEHESFNYVIALLIVF
jgi:hypothetical protein